MEPWPSTEQRVLLWRACNLLKPKAQAYSLEYACLCALSLETGKCLWRHYLEGGKGAPEWMWPIIGMRGALGMWVDLHSGNVMLDPLTSEYIMTDPFSCAETTS